MGQTLIRGGYESDCQTVIQTALVGRVLGGKGDGVE
jgi:hypothetical protein